MAWSFGRWPWTHGTKVPRVARAGSATVGSGIVMLRTSVFLALVGLLAACGTSPAAPPPHADAHTDTPAPIDTPVVTDAPADTAPSQTDAVTDAALDADAPTTDRPIGPAAALYESCAGPGAACEGSSTCLQSLAFIQGPGPRFVCTKTCSVATDCPNYTPDGGVDCLHTSRGAPQCGVHCNHGDVDCMPYNLNCFATSGPDGGAMVEFCVP